MSKISPINLPRNFSGLGRCENYFLNHRFCPSNIVAFGWCLLLGLYSLKAFALAFGATGCVVWDCSVGDFFSGLMVGLALTMAVSIADFIALEDLRGGTWVFLGGIVAWSIIEKIEASIALKKYLPTEDDLAAEVKKYCAENTTMFFDREEIVKKLIQQKSPSGY